MASNGLMFATRPDVAAEAGAEGLQNHGNVSLGILTANQTKPALDVVTVTHGPTWPPMWNLAVESDAAPAWMANITITPTALIFPPIPGPGASPTIPGVSPIMPSIIPATWAPGEPTTVAAWAAANVAGGVLHFSNPGTIWTLVVAGTVPPGLLPGLYTHKIYLTASMGPPPAPRVRVARIILGLQVQRDGV